MSFEEQQKQGHNQGEAGLALSEPQAISEQSLIPVLEKIESKKENRYVFLPKSENPCYKKFIESLRSQETRKVYSNALENYLKIKNVTFDTCNRILEGTAEKIEDQVIDYLQILNDSNYKYNTKQVRIAALRHFYIMNRINLNWPLVYKYLGERITIEDRPYTDKEIKKIIDVIEKDDYRNLSIIYLLESSGMRIGALPFLRLKDLTWIPSHSTFSFVVYAGTEFAYRTYCTPQCASYIKLMIEGRKEKLRQKGQELGKMSFLFTSKYDESGLSKSTFTNTLSILLQKAGIRKPIEGLLHKRYDVMLDHGFRKFFTGRLQFSGVAQPLREKMLGHKNTLDRSYLLPEPLELFFGTKESKGYVYALDSLTIA